MRNIRVIGEVVALFLMSLITFDNTFAKDTDQIARGSLLSLSSTTVSVGKLSCRLNSDTNSKIELAELFRQVHLL